MIRALLLLACLVLACPLPAQEVRRLPAPADFSVEEILPPVEPDAPSVISELAIATPPPPAPHWYQPSYWFDPTPWDTGIEFGLNGSSGTSNTLSTRAGGYSKLKTDLRKLDLSLYHNRTKSAGEETQNNALLDVRHDWLLTDSPWSLFVMNQTFYDEFQAFDLNVNVNTGIGYQWFDTDFAKFGTSLGAGASREFGGVRDEWVPEAQVGFKWEQNLCDTQKFYAKLDYFPEWEDLGRYRMVSDIGWQVQLSRPSNVSLKFSLSDRFDSNPDGVNPHNTNYSVLLLWKK